MAQRRVEMGRQEMLLRCDCGWRGAESDVTDWDVQWSHDRVVRKCPNCEEPVPEWGSFRPIDGVARIAKGQFEEALEQAGVFD
jgi:hypothetical protein